MSQSVTVRALSWILLLSLVATSLGVGQVADTPRIESVAYKGDGSVSAVEDELIVWESATHRFSVAVIGGHRSVDASLCLDTVANGTAQPQELACQPISVAANRSLTATVSVDRWPANVTGRQTVRAVLRSPDSRTIFSREYLSLSVIPREGDIDGDGLPNDREASLGTMLRDDDSDEDGIPDGVEVRTYGTSPTNADTDGDGLSDEAEINRYGTDPKAADPDGDDLADPRELTIGTDPGTADTDGDGVNDAAEVNTYGTDPLVADTDGDGLDDGEEVKEHKTNPLQPDTDEDGLTDTLEVNTYETDPNNVDTDGDGLQDGAEVNVHKTDPADPDMDGDGLTDGQEINTYGTNPVDADTDSDGLHDGVEVDRYETNPTVADTDGDGLSDRVEVNERSLLRQSPVASVAIGVTLIALAGVGIRYWSGRGRRLGRRLWSEPAESADRPDPDGGAAEAGDATAATDEVPPEFLSNDDRVMALLDRHGGRMPQAKLVEETGWSKSKVSRVLSSMEDDETIVKVDVGRGNIVTRPEDLPRGARSPFED